MNTWQHFNPYTNELVLEGDYMSEKEWKGIVSDQQKIQKEWRLKTVAERLQVLFPLKELILKELELWASTATETMGKPIAQARAEVHKCISLLDYYQEVSEEALKEELSDIEGASIKMEAQGIILGVMPWNFPYWQVFRFAIPALIGGNTVLLKHAPNSFVCGDLMQGVFNQLSVPGIFSNLMISHEDTAALMNSGQIHGFSFTGSTGAGKVLGAIAGANLLPSVLELGGNNTFFVDQDVDVKEVVKEALLARLQNNGQSCIAAKRFLIHKTLYADFKKELLAALAGYKVSDPLREDSLLGPLARLDLAEQLEEQVKQSVDQGAKEIVPFRRNDAAVEVAVLELSDSVNISFEEELFGPVFVLCGVESWEEMIKISNRSKFGLGAMLYTQKQGADLDQYIAQLDEGAVFVNHFTKSHPALPFGGVKGSGYGRELGIDGLYSFLNKKLIWKKA